MAQVQNILADDRDRDEEALVEGLKTNQPAQVEDLLRRTHRPVYALTARLTTDPDLRHDWSQDILLKIVKEMGTGRFVYQRPGCFWAWFKARSNFLLINLYNQHQKDNKRYTAGETGAAIVDKLPFNQGVDPLKLLEAVETRRVVEKCLEELPSQDQRHALHLILFQDLPYQEVADYLGTTINTVRSWIRRGRISLRQCIQMKLGKSTNFPK